MADLICLVDFALTRNELRDIRPDAAHRVDNALEVLAPVLVERAAQGGVRVYHESFARYLRRRIQNDTAAVGALIGRVTDWLEQQGMFEDTRAFRSLIPLLAEAGRDRRGSGPSRQGIRSLLRRVRVPCICNCLQPGDGDPLRGAAG